MAFLSTIYSGNTNLAHLKLKPMTHLYKVYGIDTVSRYQTPEDDTEYSDTLQAPVEVKEAGLLQRILGWI